MQLSDFNYAMLRVICSFYLIIFASIVFLVGLLLIPIGYCSIVIIRVRIILRELGVGRKREHITYQRKNSDRELNRKIIRLVSFVLSGVLELAWRAFLDTLVFIR